MPQYDTVIDNEPVNWPAFAFPFTARAHPGLARAGRHCVSWARHVGLVRGEEALRNLEKARLEGLAAVIHPDAEQHVADLATDWLVWIVVLDDLCDEGELRYDRALARSVFDELLAVLTEDCGSVEATTSVGAALSDLWLRTAPALSLSWRRRFRHQLGLVLDAIEEELTRQATDTVPSVASFMTERVGGTLNRTALEAWAACGGVELPIRLYGDGAALGPAERLMRTAERIIWWCNDILSLPKDIAQNDLSNMVIAVRRERGLDYQKAMDAVRDLVAAETVTLLSVEAELAEAAGPAAADTVRAAVDLVHHHIAGNIGWSMASGRYQQADPVERGRIAGYAEPVALAARKDRA